MRFRNLVVVGTSHIAQESVHDIDEVMNNFHPGVVALELDRHRLDALVHERRHSFSLQSVRQVGVKGFIFSVVGAWIEQRLGKKVGMKPGADMLHAFQRAQGMHASVALIDQDITVTLRRFSQALSWGEKLQFFLDIIFSFFSWKRHVKIDLSKVPSQRLVYLLVQEVRQKYPNVYRVLVEERNSVMADNLIRLMQKFPDVTILAVIGAGHKQDVVSLVKRRFKNANVLHEGKRGVKP